MDLTVGEGGENPFTFSLTADEIHIVAECINSFTPEWEQTLAEEQQGRLGSGINVFFATGGKEQSLTIFSYSNPNWDCLCIDEVFF